MYSLGFEPRAYRLFKKLDLHIRQEIGVQAEKLRNNPLLGEQLQGKFRRLRSLHFSYRGVAYRIIYAVHPDEQTVVIHLADKRENLYKRLEETGR